MRRLDSNKSQKDHDMSHEIEKISSKFLPGNRNFDIRYPLIIALVSAFLGTLAFVRASGVGESERSVALSNGKVIHLGESKAELSDALKSDLHVVNKDLYQYPADPKKPVEALIYAQNERVTAIELISGTSTQISTGIRLGVNQSDIMERLSSRLSALNQKLDTLKYRGMSVKQLNSDVYFMTPPCIDSTKIIDVTLVDKDYVPTLQSKLTPVDCKNIVD